MRDYYDYLYEAKMAQGINNKQSMAYALIDIGQSLRTIAGNRDSVGVDELRIELDYMLESDSLTAEEIAAQLLQRFDIKQKVPQ